jgi:2-amino-4-hydroxy-6-hydroxymethyldihydropteridine diphosphokinase
MTEVYVAAGSNIEPERNLTLASQELVRVFPDTRFSSWYRNPAVGFQGDDFINFVAGFSSDLPVHEVVRNLQAIETLCGRPRGAPRCAPRSMDLDILLYDALICDEPKLKLPRPDLLKRAFMLGPLAELAPELMHPTAGMTIRELWSRFDAAAHPMQKVPAMRGQPEVGQPATGQPRAGQPAVGDPSPSTSPRSGPRPPRESDR